MTGQHVILQLFMQSFFARFDLPVLCKIEQLWNRIWRQKAFAAGEEVARTTLPVSSGSAVVRTCLSFADRAHTYPPTRGFRHIAVPG
eukprot:7068-Amphidinium_carterae.1